MRAALQRTDMTMMQIRRRNQTLAQAKVHLETKVKHLKKDLFLAREANPAHRMQRLMESHPRMVQVVVMAATILALAAALAAAVLLPMLLH